VTVMLMRHILQIEAIRKFLQGRERLLQTENIDS
jgi:hypothetical protein